MGSKELNVQARPDDDRGAIINGETECLADEKDRAPDPMPGSAIQRAELDAATPAAR